MNNHSSINLLPEWWPQAAVMLTWPHPNSDWEPLLAEVEPVFIELVSQISQHESALIVCYDTRHQQYIGEQLQQHAVDLKNIYWLVTPTNDTWVRDYGPISVLDDGQLKLLNFQFNGWGGKYAHDFDNAVNQRGVEAGLFNAPVIDIDLILEGGSIDYDGNGTLLTTQQCLLSVTRNSQLDRQQIESRLRESLGVQRVIWLQHGHLAGDDTDAHVDTLARFCNPNTIAYASCDNPEDEHYINLLAMELELQSLRTADGEAYQLIPLPIPDAHFHEGRRLPATYANFLIINDVVLVPTYDDIRDEIVLERLQAVFTPRKVIGIPCSSIIKQFGSLHCLTMQLPTGSLT